MSTLKRHLLNSLILLLLLCGCTDRRIPKQAPVLKPVKAPPVNLEPAADVLFRNKDTTALRMVAAHGGLYLTGYPFGFARWDISADPEKPSLTFAASDNIAEFSPPKKLGGWTVDAYGANSLAIVDSFALLSGNAGLSVIDISETHQPVEVRRYPIPKGLGVDKDERFVYQAMVLGDKYLFGLRSQDYVYYLDRKNLPDVQLVTKDAYASDPICCVRGAASFQGFVFIALKTRLWLMDPDGQGYLTPYSTFESLQATDVVATSRFLYVLHEATSSIESSLPSGIYVFDEKGNEVAFLDVVPLSFAISENDSHLYTNLDEKVVRIFKLNF